jgi:type IV pilus assembly protein PilM
MSTTYLGMDIGSSSVKLAVVQDRRIQRILVSDLPENLVREGRITSPEALAEELREIIRKEHIHAKNVCLSIPPQDTFVRRITVPQMTADQLKLNLPYEFHDFIQKDKDLYFYDYAVVKAQKGEDGKTDTLDLLAAAAPKETIANARMMLRKAGLKLVCAEPECLTYRNLIQTFEEKNPGSHPAEYCIADLGHEAIRVHMYRGGVYDTTREIEYGGASIDALIADTESVDPHVAANYKLSNYEGAQEIPACRDLYNKIAVEILRAVNFYGFNTPEADLQDIYFCGGLAKVTALMETIRGTLELKQHSVEELLPHLEHTDDARLLPFSPAAVGAAMELDAR